MTEEHFPSAARDEALRKVEESFAGHGDHVTSREHEVITPEVMTRQIAELAAQNEAMRPQREAEERERIESHKRWRRREKITTWRGRMKVAIAMTAIVATVKSGGFIDMAADPFVDAGGTVASEIEQTEPGRDEFVALFAKMDSDPRSVINSAEAWKLERDELFMSEDKVEQIKDEIDESESNEDTIKALNQGMIFYGIKAGFDGLRNDQPVPFESSQGEIKSLAKAIVTVFSELPRDFVELSEVEYIEFAEDLGTNSFSGGETSGQYSEGSGTLSFRPISKKDRLLSALDSYLINQDQSYEGVVGHELGHAFAAKLQLTELLKPEEVVDLDEDSLGKIYVKRISENLIKRPEYVSLYGQSDREEKMAEELSGLFADTSSGFALPDETRLFGSGANRSMIRILFQLEQHYPGIALLTLKNRSGL